MCLLVEVYQVIRTSLSICSLNQPGNPAIDSKKAQEGVKEAMHEFKEGTLKSGGKSQKKVTNPKQAIAIGLSKARKKGAKVPKKKD